jgi:hypothetical protein
MPRAIVACPVAGTLDRDACRAHSSGRGKQVAILLILWLQAAAAACHVSDGLVQVRALACTIPRQPPVSTAKQQFDF